MPDKNINNYDDKKARERVNQVQQNADVERQAFLSESVSQNPGMRRDTGSSLIKDSGGISVNQVSNKPGSSNVKLKNGASNLNSSGNNKITNKKNNGVAGVASKVHPAVGMAMRIANARKNLEMKKRSSIEQTSAQKSFAETIKGLATSRKGMMSKLFSFFGGNKSEKEEQDNKPSSLEDVSIRIPKPILIKLLLPVAAGISIVVLLLAIMTPAMQVYNHVAGDSSMDDATLNDKIESKDDNWFNEEASEDYEEDVDVTTGQASYDSYEVVPLISNALDEEVKTLENNNVRYEVKQYARKYEVGITDIIDFFGENYNCETDIATCLGTPEYKFYLKLYDIFRIYKADGIKLDMSLLMSTIMYKHTDYQILFEGNLSSYDHASLYDDEGNIIKENTAYMNWETDYKNLTNYTYLNAQDDRYDAQILAKNMVTKTIRVTCGSDTQTYVDIEEVNYSKFGIDKCSDGSAATISSSYKLDLDKYKKFLKEFIYMKYLTGGTEVTEGEVGGGSAPSGDPLSAGDSYSNGTATAPAGTVYSSEPDPSIAINYWKNYVKSSDFIYPKDSATGLSLGAWPKNYESIPTQLTSYKTYNTEFIWPVTPSQGLYTYVYTHNGIDIMAPMGTPIYAPADGTLRYSEWGHTVNKGSDETAYSVTINMSNPVTFGGYTIDTVYLTHMCGIRYRCPEGSCSRKVVKGELLGFVGNAAGTAQSVGWAPHLHMTLYNSSKGYNSGLLTNKIESLYSITANTNRNAGE